MADGASPIVADTGFSLIELRRQFERYASVKVNEINEARDAWNYFDGKQYTPTQIEILRKRGQPAITFDRTSTKISSIVGVVRQIRTDPKAFPRTQKGEAGAELATQVVRYVLDASHFEDVETECVEDASIYLAVCEMLLNSGDQGDPDVDIKYVDASTFFYDPRSTRPDFSDARFMGVAKWVDKAELEELAPGSTEGMGDAGGGDGNYITDFDTDKEIMWTDERGRYRLVDHWYIANGGWKWCMHVGTKLIDSGDSPFFDPKGKSICKFFAFANKIDKRGDHYGFIRALKGPQDAINQHRSKALHIMNARQLFAEDGAFTDVEATRREAARPDGIILVQPGSFEKFKVDQPNQEFLMQTEYYNDAKAEMDNFGPNPTLTGNDPKEHSGRALAMLKQAGLAALGKFLKNYRQWKLAIYQAIWCTAQRYWTAERWIRVTEDRELAGFLQINGMQIDPMTGIPQMVNAIGAIDVDIVMDEGPDTEVIRGDVNDTMEALAHNGVPVPPQLFIEMSDLPKSVKDKATKIMQESAQSDPMAEAAKGAGLAKIKTEIEKTKAETYYKAAQAEQILAEIGQLQAEIAVARTQGWIPQAQPAPANGNGPPSPSDQRAAPQPPDISGPVSGLPQGPLPTLAGLSQPQPPGGA